MIFSWSTDLWSPFSIQPALFWSPLGCQVGRHWSPLVVAGIQPVSTSIQLISSWYPVGIRLATIQYRSIAKYVGTSIYQYAYIRNPGSCRARRGLSQGGWELLLRVPTSPVLCRHSDDRSGSGVKMGTPGQIVTDSYVNSNQSSRPTP